MYNAAFENMTPVNCMETFFPPAKRSCGKLMFLHLSAILFTRGGGGVSAQEVGVCVADTPTCCEQNDRCL